jgi:hypothetical protein
MLDKRALKNEEMYKQKEKESTEYASKLDWEKLKKENKETVEQVGTCVMTTLDTVEVMQELDCMCIGLSIGRPEAAIADPSRLIIEEVFPSYLSA